MHEADQQIGDVGIEVGIGDFDRLLKADGLRPLTAAQLDNSVAGPRESA